MQKQTAVTAYFPSKQLLLFAIAPLFRSLNSFQLLVSTVYEFGGVTYCCCLSLVSHRYPSKHDTLNRCWFLVGPSSATLAQHQTSIDSMCHVCWLQLGFSSLPVARCCCCFRCCRGMSLAPPTPGQMLQLSDRGECCLFIHQIPQLGAATLPRSSTQNTEIHTEPK